MSSKCKHKILPKVDLLKEEDIKEIMWKVAIKYRVWQAILPDCRRKKQKLVKEVRGQWYLNKANIQWW